jgi:sugar O-acyltransferase (sialic acid O-acetyltransferase NeuD family)
VAKIVVFGSGQVAETIYDYLKFDSPHEVVAFTLDQEWIKDDHFKNLPVIPFEKVTDYYSPQDHLFFTAISYKRMNALRKQKYLEAKLKGYSFLTYIHSRAYVWPSATIGENTFIMEANVIQSYAHVGHNVIIWSGNHIGHHSRIKDHCFIASHAVISGSVEIGEGSFIGVNATLRDQITLGERCAVGAGALVMQDAPDETVFPGNSTKPIAVKSSQLRSL